MLETLLRTKLFVPPLRPNLVPRPQLIESLDHGLQLGHKLFLISAPAGFGKTTLVTEWMASLRSDPSKERQIANTIAWLSLDKNDNDPTRFLTYLVTALNEAEGIENDIGIGALGILQSPQPAPAESVLTSLINDITVVAGSIILVLDDYHLIDSSLVDDTLTFLLEHLPPQMHLVIATRIDPNLPLARLRARGQLTELRAMDLRFTFAEATEFLNRIMGLNLSLEDIAALETRSEGWIAGLQLAAISLQRKENSGKLIKSFSGSHRLVLDYLVEEVLDQQSASVQTFLMKTAVLDRLNSSLCVAVTGQENGQQTLEYLDQTNLFIIPLDEQRHWYRYHHLFADLLRQRLRQTQPEQLPILHRRASEWCEQEGFVDQAIDHALRGEHYERAANLIEEQFGANYERRDQTAYRRWLAEMPEEFVFSKPDLCILNAWNLFTSGQLDAAERSLQTAEKILDGATRQELVSPLDKYRLSEAVRMNLGGRVAAIRSFLASYNGDIEETIRYAHQALENLPEQELAWRSATLIALGDAYADIGQMAAAKEARTDALMAGEASGDTHLLMIISLRLAEILRQQGKLQQVIDICEREFETAEEKGITGSAVIGWLFGIWGEVLAELDHLDDAEELAKKGVKLTGHGRDLLYEVMSNLCLVRVLFSGGKITDIQDVIEAMEKTASETDMPQWALSQLSAWQARIFLKQGKLEIASQWARERELVPDGEPSYLREIEYTVFARILTAQRRLDEAILLLQHLFEAAIAGGRTSDVIEIRILQALTFQAMRDTDQAISTLEQSLALAESGGFIRIFVDEGPPMAQLLYTALSRGIAPEYVRRLLSAFPDAEPKQANPSDSHVPKIELIEPLSERELEVLQLIAEGLTNRDIASRLFLSPNTVKTHTRNINGKLDTHNRTQAVARGRALGILPTT